MISTVEAGYDLRPREGGWLPRVLEASLPFLDRGSGAGGLIAVKPPTPEPLRIVESHVASGPTDLMMRHAAATASVPQEPAHQMIRSGPCVLTEMTAAHPDMLETWRSHFDGAKDAVGVMALDTDGYGVHMLAPTKEVVRLDKEERSLWRMLAAHLSSGLRLRRAVSTERARTEQKPSALPHGADAVITPKSFAVTDAVADGTSPSTLRLLRNAAMQIDRARSRKHRRHNTVEALKAWWALVRGRHSIVDWFDTDGRRYILAIPNPPYVAEVLGLTESEIQVVQYAVLGDTHKTIGYRLGIHRSTVSKALGSAMRKLGVKTQAGLVAKLKPVLDATKPSDAP